MECSMPTPRDAYPGAQTCMDSNVVRAYFGSGLIRPRAQTNSEWFMRTPRDACPGAQTCCASPTQTPARLANSRRTWSRRRTRKSKCVPSRWKVLSGEFRRRPTALARNFANRIVSVAEDCLSPERTFHGCSLMYFRGYVCSCIRGSKSVALRAVDARVRL